jgi:tyrosyl-tRNA synthetase
VARVKPKSPDNLISLERHKHMNPEQKERLLSRGVAEIIEESEYVKLLEAGRPLRLKVGFDPSAPDLHLGHAVLLRKLRQLQDLGHQVVIIVGDWTAQIGDPSGRSALRPMLSAAQVLENAESYLEQFSKIVDRDKTEIRMQSEWFGTFNLANVIQLTSKFTVAQFLAREDFAKRFKANQPIAITELLYPLLQGYDSVAVESDVEFGGTDQKFNLLVGRDLQRMMDQRPQQCLLVPILVGTDGVRRMGKSLGNYIGLNEPPNDMYGKIMSLPDESADPDPQDGEAGEAQTRNTILDYFDYLTDVPTAELTELRDGLADGTVKPMELKKRLADELVAQFHDADAAHSARDHFERTVQRKELPDDIPIYEISKTMAGRRISDLIVDAGMAESSSAAKRLITQGAVKKNGVAVATNEAVTTIADSSIVQVGRRRMIRAVRPPKAL